MDAPDWAAPVAGFARHMESSLATDRVRDLRPDMPLSKRNARPWDLSVQARLIAEAVWTGQGLSRRDWTRALVATEFVWASDVFGSGLDSIHTWGFTDPEGIAILRSIQRKLLSAGA